MTCKIKCIVPFLFQVRGHSPITCRPAHNPNKADILHFDSLEDFDGLSVSRPIPIVTCQNWREDDNGFRPEEAFAHPELISLPTSYETDIEDFNFRQEYDKVKEASIFTPIQCAHVEEEASGPTTFSGLVKEGKTYERDPEGEKDNISSCEEADEENISPEFAFFRKANFAKRYGWSSQGNFDECGDLAVHQQSRNRPTCYRSETIKAYFAAKDDNRTSGQGVQAEGHLGRRDEADQGDAEEEGDLESKTSEGHRAVAVSVCQLCKIEIAEEAFEEYNQWVHLKKGNRKLLNFQAWLKKTNGFFVRQRGYDRVSQDEPRGSLSNFYVDLDDGATSNYARLPPTHGETPNFNHAGETGTANFRTLGNFVAQVMFSLFTCNFLKI